MVFVDGLLQTGEEATNASSHGVEELQVVELEVSLGGRPVSQKLRVDLDPDLSVPVAPREVVFLKQELPHLVLRDLALLVLEHDFVRAVELILVQAILALHHIGTRIDLVLPRRHDFHQILMLLILILLLVLVQVYRKLPIPLSVDLEEIREQIGLTLADLKCFCTQNSERYSAEVAIILAVNRPLYSPQFHLPQKLSEILGVSRDLFDEY